MNVLLLPFFVIAEVVAEVGREIGVAARVSAKRARESAAVRIRRWAKARSGRMVPEKVRRFAAKTSAAVSSAGRFAGRLLPEAVVDGVRDGAVEGKERHREFREVREVRRRVRSGDPDATHTYNQVRHRQALDRNERRRAMAETRVTRREGRKVQPRQEPRPQPRSPMPAVVDGSVSESTTERIQIPVVAGRGDQRPSRRWDREPETDTDRRFFDLRESGYEGWIDQDGRAMTDEEHAQWCRDQEQEINGHTPSNGNTNNSEGNAMSGIFGELTPHFVRAGQERYAEREYARGGAQDGTAPAEVTSVDSLRHVYASTGQDVAALKDQLGAAAQRLQATTNTYEQATGHMSSDGFAPDTLSDVAGAQEAVAQAAAKVAEALVALDEAEGAVASGERGLDQYRPAEEAVSSIHAPRSTASLRME